MSLRPGLATVIAASSASDTTPFDIILMVAVGLVVALAIVSLVVRIVGRVIRQTYIGVKQFQGHDIKGAQRANAAEALNLVECPACHQRNAERIVGGLFNSFRCKTCGKPF